MLGPGIFVSSLIPRAGFSFGNTWQYHSQSDHHSKVVCWGLLFDLLRHCALLRRHAGRGLVGFGINHEMRDFRTRRKKDLDLVICRPRAEAGDRRRLSFADRGAEIGVVLDDRARAELSRLPALWEEPVGAVHVALEAKACMTEFQKARPRLYDELNSSHLAVHGNSPNAIAAGLAVVNVADRFISPNRNKYALSERAPEVSHHQQPQDAIKAIEKLHEIPRRANDTEEGFDALAIILIDLRNDGTPVRLVEAPPAPEPGDIYHYEMAVHRLAQLYEQRFPNVT